MRFSASRMKTWMECPKKADFHYNYQYPSRQSGKATFGSIIHSCLELYNNTGNYELAVQTFKDQWLTPPDGLEPEWWPKFTSYQGLRQRGLEVLEQVHEKTKWDTREVVATEHPFLVKFGKHQLTGYVDLLEVRTSGKGKNLLRIVDYKTAARKPNMGALALDIQFTIYDYASRQPEFWTGWKSDGTPEGDIDAERFPGMPNGAWLEEFYRDGARRNIWYHLWTAQELDAGSRDNNDFGRLYRTMEEIDRSREAGIYIPRIGEACSLCDYTEPCGVYVPTKEELADEDFAWI